MLRYILRRIALLSLSAILASSAVFFLLRTLPGDAALAMSGLEATPEQIEALVGGHKVNVPQPSSEKPKGK